MYPRSLSLPALALSLPALLSLASCQDIDPVAAGAPRDVDVAADVDAVALALLNEVVTFSFDTGGFLHPDLSDDSTRVKFFSPTRIEFNWGSGAAVYGWDLSSTGVAVLGDPEFQGGDFPPDAEVDRELALRFRIRAVALRPGGDPVSGTLVVSIEDRASEPEPVTVRLEEAADGGLVVRAGEGGHPVARLP